jgi:tetratricopeptide (TPR) repeat protein
MKMVRKVEELKNHEIAKRDSLIMDLQSEIRQKKSELEDVQAALAEKQDSLHNLKIDSLRGNLKQIEQKLRELQKYLPLKNQQIALLMAPLPETILLRTRSRGDDLAPTLADAFEAFDASKFDDAADLLRAISPSDTLLQRGAAQLLPYALFYSGKFEAATRAFTELKALDKYEAKNADGYMLLCYVAQGRYSDAKPLLTTILKDPDHPFHEQAKKLKTTLAPEFY